MVLAALLVTGLFQAIVAPAGAPERAAPPPQVMPATVWQEAGWRALPTRRQDLAANRDDPLNLQLAGDPEQLARALGREGWHRPVAPSGADLLRFLAPTTKPERLPLLPRVHDGRYEQLRRIRVNAAGELQVVRLWPTAWRLTDGRPLWVGQAGRLRPISPGRLFAGLAGAEGYTEAAHAVARALEVQGWRVDRGRLPGDGGPLYRLEPPSGP